MSQGVKIVENQKLPIELQIADRDATRFPRAVIRNDSNATITVIDMNHLDEGLYKPAADVFMTSNDFITVQYLIYDDAGYTTLAGDLSVDNDVFVRESVHELVWDEPLADHQISGSTGETLGLLEVLDLDTLVSKIMQSDLTVTVESDESMKAHVELEEDIIAQIDEENALEALVDAEQTLNATLNSEEIIGVLDEC